MAFQCNIPFALQIFSIAAGAFGIIVAIVMMIQNFTIEQIIVDCFAILFSLVIIGVELYVFEFFKYFTFILTFWGKGATYIFMGFFIFAPKGIGLFGAIVFWILFVCSVIAYFIFHHNGVSQPLLQKNKNVTFKVTNTDYYQSGASAAPNASAESNNGWQQNDYPQNAQADSFYNQPGYQ